MYPLYFYICLLFSVAMLTTLILLAIFPIRLPIAVKTTKQPRPIVHHHKARSPTKPTHTINFWDPPWTDDDEDL